ncbi:universal stress protein [Halobium salinum]|uniref:Universal stress protein n=1 Tax=Halobium salinum TaxID=1364940 RepID=A0ABD5PE43_9EURY|nr:universal stress protein [Halobium salinum]
MYDRILVPTDGSTGVGRAVDHAIGLAAAHDAVVEAVYVVNSGGLAGLPMESSWEGVDELLRSDAEAAVEAVERRARDCGVEASGRVLEGAPHREIVRFAESEDCDLVVMGTHGRGGIDRLLLGSVAEKVVRASRVPVMTVHVDGEDGEGGTPAEASAEAGADADFEGDLDLADEHPGESVV